MEHYKPENLTLWSTPEHWVGTPWHGYYVFLLQHKGSHLMEQSNFICGLEAVGGKSETVRVVCESHWAVGWIEWIGIHESDTQALKIADEIAGALADYPVLDECHYCDLEAETIGEYWECVALPDRVELCAEAGVSVFASRHACIPERVYPIISNLVNGG